MTRKKRYAIVGTGSRAGMFVNAITGPYIEVAELVGFCDLSHTRMDWYNRQLASKGHAAVLTYPAANLTR